MKRGKLLVLAAMVSPLIALPSYANWDPSYDLKAYEQQLKARVELGQKWGDFSDNQLSELQGYMRGLYKLEKRCARDGMSEQEKKLIWNQLEQLDQKITAQLQDRQSSGWINKWDRDLDGLAFWKKHRTRVDSTSYETRLRDTTARIVTGIGSGQISPGEASYLNGEVARLKVLLENYRGSDGKITADEGTSLNTLLTRLDQRIAEAEQTAPTATSHWNSGNWHHGWTNSKHTFANHLPNPPKWSVNRDHGYIDSTGQIKGIIPGNELYRYGGTMSDGRPTPTTPNVHLNSRSHIIW